MNIKLPRGFLVALVVGTALASAAGCSKFAKRRADRAAARDAARATPAAGASSQRITLDGEFDDWPKGVAALADPDWIYLRITVEEGSAPLQAAPETLALWIDADADGKTGEVMPAPAEAASLGVDEVVEYSPPDPQNPGKMLTGAKVHAADGRGGTVELKNVQVGLSSLPTYASTAYEVRLSRHIDAATAPGLAKALEGRGRARAMFVMRDAGGKLIGWSDPETFSKPAARSARGVAELTVPAKAPGTIRIVSYNVLKSKLMKEPNTFARIFQVLDPDVILAQEWDADAATATAWFTAVVTGQHEWYARSGGADVVIVSPHKISALGPEALSLPTGADGKPDPIRFVAGLVKTPIGEIAVGSLHLKCCGTIGSTEDQKRQAQAEAINAAMKSALGQSGTAVRVFGGDFNLVGSRRPLDTFCAGLDADGSELTAATPFVLGDAATYTWMDAQTAFPPGRLDYVTFSDASAQIVDAFVLDTALLGDKSLARMGLDKGDTSASDHLPVVVDLKPR